MRHLPLLLCALVLAAVTAAPLRAQKQQLILGEDFAKAELTAADSDRVTVGNLAITSNKKTLAIVDIGDGKKVLRFTPGKGAWLRFGFTPVTPTTNDALVVQIRFRCPKGATNKAGALRLGVYHLADADNTAATLPEDQGFFVFTNLGAPADLPPDTKFVCDQNAAGGDGKWPGFLGGGSGTQAGGEAGPHMDIGDRWATASLVTRPVASKGKLAWQLNFSLTDAVRTISHARRFGESKAITLESLNTAGLSIGSGDVLHIDTLVVTVLTKN